MTTLRYPLSAEPVPGDASRVAVAPNLHWLRMPLAGSLRWINVWAFREPDGLSIVDTGIFSAPTIHAWQAALPELLPQGAIGRVVVTHMHPDHCGLAGWFSEQYGAQLWMSRLEYLTCRVLASEHGRPAPADCMTFYRRSGWDEDSLERYRTRYGYFGTLITPLPASFQRISEGDEITLGEHTWRVIVGSGHSPEHACLYCEDRKLLISGDQVLPRISSNVSVYPTEPDADPLSDWMRSLRRLRDTIPPDVLVLPAHNSPFIGLHERIGALLMHHEHALESLLELLVAPKRAVDCFATLFARTVPADLLMMATGEALAHLNHLRRLGLIDRELDSEGAWQWSRT